MQNNCRDTKTKTEKIYESPNIIRSANHHKPIQNHYHRQSEQPQTDAKDRKAEEDGNKTQDN